MIGEFYRRLVAYGPELIGRAEYYEAVKAVLKEAAADFNHYHNLKPEYKLEWIERCIKKWFGTPVIPVNIANEDGQYNGHHIFQKTPILENELSKTRPDPEGPPGPPSEYLPCFGAPFTQPECRLCYLLEKCCLGGIP